MLRSECLLLLNINFVNTGKECKKAIIFLMSLLNYTEEENFDKTGENLKYLNDISGNLLQIFAGKDITSNLETHVKFFMSETVSHFFFFFFCYARRNKIFSSANIHQFGLLKYFCQKECQCDWVLHVYLLYTTFGQTDRNTVVVLIKYAYLNVFIIIIILYNLS